MISSKNTETDDAPPKREFKDISLLKYIEPKYVSQSHKDDDGHKWNFLNIVHVQNHKQKDMFSVNSC
jgi:hypothetical protein